MSALLDRARTWLIGQMQAADPIAATYTDASSGTAITLTVWLGRTRFASNIEGKARIEFGEMDVLLKADDLAVNGSRIDPAKGDSIVLTLNGVEMTLELFTPSTGEPAWRYADPTREILRVHCKRVA